MADDTKSHRLIKSSDPTWLEKALECYRDKHPFRFEDDACLRIREQDLISAVSLIKRARQTGALTWNEIGQVLTGLGMSAAGVWLIRIAVRDPEPTSRLGILLVGGVVLIVTGGLSILRAFRQGWRVSAKHGGTTFTIEPK